MDVLADHRVTHEVRSIWISYLSQVSFQTMFFLLNLNNVCLKQCVLTGVMFFVGIGWYRRTSLLVRRLLLVSMSGQAFESDATWEVFKVSKGARRQKTSENTGYKFGRMNMLVLLYVCVMLCSWTLMYNIINLINAGRHQFYVWFPLLNASIKAIECITVLE